jgi:hypothetical protein
MPESESEEEKDEEEEDPEEELCFMSNAEYLTKQVEMPLR